LVEAVHGRTQTRLQGADDGICGILDDDSQRGCFFITKFAEHMPDEAIPIGAARLSRDA
jgi:hypothetical protein